MEFKQYINSPIAVYKDELCNFPFNMNTFSKMWNIRTPQKIAEQVADLKNNACFEKYCKLAEKEEKVIFCFIMMIQRLKDISRSCLQDTRYALLEAHDEEVVIFLGKQRILNGVELRERMAAKQFVYQCWD